MVTMRWLQNLSFASSPPSSSSSSTVSSSKNEGDNNNTHGDQQSLNGVSRRRFRFAAAKLWHRRKLRHMTDQEVSKEKVSCDMLAISSRTSCASTTAIPMPLPLPVPEIEVETRLQLGKEVCYGKAIEDQVRDDRNGDGFSASCPALSSMGSTQEKKAPNRLGSRSSSSRSLYQNLNVMHTFGEAFIIDVTTRSAATSPSCSPLPSPQRTQPHDKIPYFYMVHRGNQGWSAPEMPTVDHPGAFPNYPSYLDYSIISDESSPHHSPPNRSPCRSIKSASGPASPLHPRLSSEISGSRQESFASVHRLPLPPGATISSPSTPAPQVTTKLEPMSMNCQWQKGKLIGRGTFGSVYVASNRETGALCAMKEVDIFPDDPKSAECIKQLEQEIKVLSQLKHPNIVQYYGSEIKEDKFNIYLEYVHPGSINKYVREHCGAITESVVRNFTRHILCGLAYLHNKKTIHRDIKGANLLVDASGVVKLADFGMAKHLTGQRLDLSLKGSPYWMAPELMQAVIEKENSSDHAFAIDIWSLGCTIIEMLTGKPPWSEYEGAAAMFKVMKDTPAIPENLSPEGKDFLHHCFQRNPADRPSAIMLLEHRFAKNLFQPSVPSGVTLINGRKSVDLPIGPRELLYEVKVDEFSGISGPSSSSSKPRTPGSEIERLQCHQETTKLTVSYSHSHSPRSTLEPLPGSSPICTYYKHLIEHGFENEKLW